MSEFTQEQRDQAAKVANRLLNPKPQTFRTMTKDERLNYLRQRMGLYSMRPNKLGEIEGV